MKTLLSISLLFLLAVVVNAVPAKPRPQIMGITLDMRRAAAQARLQTIGSLAKQDQKRQEVWAIRDQRISHLLIGYDAENRVRYVTAIARADGPRLRYEEVADIKVAERISNQGNLKFTWQVAAHRRQIAFILVARGHDPQYLDSYSIKKMDREGEEID